ncbi:calcineurin-like phosphoesterase family protein [Limimaricola soesokkakensis]|uniref:Calcineurin-like phosphoesterase family protein n=1 Tax=Limimaricola soesokkakensis TaxID=1343159 RepID=A0A1X6ZS67_9RHOB|nr:metallophosphoesterase [Limimaricola soesokkakensis]PSK84055.1 calcineurin-like phosphoesterase family protein [Limimaricola soesokkakensis]SLN59743.1 Calcineurin-like phosphoesterase superfamily domain protein [Limimaricola soesokkakensis]
MKTLILADLHWDRWNHITRDPLEGCEDLLEGVYTLILAGDIAHEPLKKWPRAIEYVRKRMPYADVHIFPGNHDFYGSRLDREPLMAACAQKAGASYAQMRQILCGDTRFLCATLWTDFELGGDFEVNKRRAVDGMNDFRRIHVGESWRALWCSDLIRLHRQHRAWLEDRLAETWPGRTIVVTHHAPHPAVIKRYDVDLSAAFGSDLGDLMTGPSAPDLWLYGHTHDLIDARVGRTEIRSVALGYPDHLPRGSDIRERIERMIIDV